MHSLKQVLCKCLKGSLEDRPEEVKTVCPGLGAYRPSENFPSLLFSGCFEHLSNSIK